MISTDSYRITIRRPIAGRMREVGDIVALTPREAEAELPWGGLEPVAPPVPGTAVATEANRKKAPKAV